MICRWQAFFAEHGAPTALQPLSSTGGAAGVFRAGMGPGTGPCRQLVLADSALRRLSSGAPPWPRAQSGLNLTYTLAVALDLRLSCEPPVKPLQRILPVRL